MAVTIWVPARDGEGNATRSLSKIILDGGASVALTSSGNNIIVKRANNEVIGVFHAPMVYGAEVTES